MKKFIIFCPPRTGSMLLCHALDNHSQLSCGFELLNPDQKHPTGARGKRHTGWLEKTCVKLYNKKCSDMVLKERVYDADLYDLRLLIKAGLEEYSGFKAIYHQCPVETWKSIADDLDVKVIFLKRDWVEVLISFIVAWNSQIWHVEAQGIEDQPLVVSFKEAITFFDTWIDEEEKFKKIFKSHITIDYKDLINNWDDIMLKTQTFLEVPQEKLPMLLKKRTVYKPEKIILNYDNLTDLFVGSRYETFFKKRSFNIYL